MLLEELQRDIRYSTEINEAALFGHLPDSIRLGRRRVNAPSEEERGIVKKGVRKTTMVSKTYHLSFKHG